MKMGIDVDDVICDFVTPFLRYYNKKHNKQVKKEDINSYDLTKVLDLDKSKVVNLINDFYLSKDFSKILPRYDAYTCIPNLVFDEKILITARPDWIRDKTKFWVDKYFKNTFNDIYMGIKDKSGLCKALDIDIMVDDKGSAVVDCGNNGITAILLNQPWNQNTKLNNNITRANNWKEIMEMQK